MIRYPQFRKDRSSPRQAPNFTAISGSAPDAHGRTPTSTVSHRCCRYRIPAAIAPRLTCHPATDDPRPGWCREPYSPHPHSPCTAGASRRPRPKTRWVSRHIYLAQWERSYNWRPFSSPMNARWERSCNATTFGRAAGTLASWIPGR